MGCPACYILITALEQANANTEQANANTKVAIVLYDDLVVQRDRYKQMLEELISSVKAHIAICHPEPNASQLSKWMN